MQNLTLSDNKNEHKIVMAKVVVQEGVNKGKEDDSDEVENTDQKENTHKGENSEEGKKKETEEKLDALQNKLKDEIADLEKQAVQIKGNIAISV